MKKLRRNWSKFLNTRLGKTLKEYFGLEDAISLLALLTGLLYYSCPSPSAFYSDIHTDLITIGITVLLLGNASENAAVQAEKRRLILQMGSTDNSFAIEATRQIYQRGWLVDGTLRKARLNLANLANANLSDAYMDRASFFLAKLEGSDLNNAHLERADLTSAFLRNAFLADAHLEGARLSGSRLQDARLTGAHLEGANLTYAHLEGALLAAITYDDKTLWKGAVFTTGDEGTLFPDGFNPIEKGMVCAN
jgi:hypothetical protein